MPGRRAGALAAALAATAGLAFPRTARADDAQALDAAKAPFDHGQYLEAHARLSALLDPKLPPCDGAPITTGCHLTNPELIERARAFDAASLLALKRDAEADRLIGTILRTNPNYVPSPAVFPQEVIDHFITVRASLDAELRAITEQRAKEAEAKRLAAQKAHEEEEAWIGNLQDLASKERWVQPNSRWVAMVPFGVGQFQNGNVPLGVTFAVAEALFGATSLVSLAVVQNLAKTDIYKPLPVGQTLSVPALNTQISTAVLVNQISFTGWAVLTAAGIIQAQVGFVPEKVTFHPRPIPPRPRIAPVAVPLPHGAVLGLGGTF